MVDRLDWAIFKSIASISKAGSRRGFRNVVPKFLIFKKVLDGGKSSMKGECVSEPYVIVKAL